MSIDPETQSVVDNGAAKIDYYYTWIDTVMKHEVCDWPWFSE
jgi:transcription elongation factor Elf1